MVSNDLFEYHLSNNYYMILSKNQIIYKIIKVDLIHLIVYISKWIESLKKFNQNRELEQIQI